MLEREQDEAMAYIYIYVRVTAEAGERVWDSVCHVTASAARLAKQRKTAKRKNKHNGWLRKPAASVK